MGSEDHKEIAESSKTALGQLTDAPSEQMARERSAKRRQIILAAFVSLACAALGLFLFA